MTTTSILAAARARCGGAPVLAVVVLAVVAALAPAVSAEVSSSSSKESKDLLTTNHQLLSGLGLARLPGHGQGMLPSKKVPATEDDSRVFVVRLPPSQHYYSLLKSPPSLANSVSKQVEVGFRSNGKPARVYHWNIPVLKKMAAARRRSTQGNGSQPKPAKNPSKSKLGATRRKAAAYHRVQQQQLKAKQQQQQLHQQQHQQHQQLEAGPEPAGPSPYYYVPAKKTSMHKLLGGNGKPHAMYVLEKSRTPAYFQRLLP